MDQDQAEAELERKLARVRWCCQGFSDLYEHGQNRSMFAVLVSRDSPVRFADPMPLGGRLVDGVGKAGARSVQSFSRDREGDRVLPDLWPESRRAVP